MIALVRQRPALGDALLLQPVIANIPEPVTVVTDPDYAMGGLVDLFRSMRNVADVIPISPWDWTTEGNGKADPQFIAPSREPVPFQLRKYTILDANSAFIDYEREYRGNPPLGIREFWWQHFGNTGPAPLPEIVLHGEAMYKAALWVSERARVAEQLRVGVVLRAGDPVRDWDKQGLARTFCDYLYTSGHNVFTIDPILQIGGGTIPVIGKRIMEVAAIISRLDVLVTPDTGLLHLAQAVGTPTIAIWGIMPPELRLSGYNTTLTPHLGCCDWQDRDCTCWKFQRYSCLQRVRISHLVQTFEKWKANYDHQN